MKGMDAMINLTTALAIWGGFVVLSGTAMHWAKQEGEG